MIGRYYVLLIAMRTQFILLLCVALSLSRVESDCDDIVCAENVQCWSTQDLSGFQSAYDDTEQSCDCQCNIGFICDDGSCEDMNECENIVRDTFCFPSIHECINTYGGYYCQCQPGREEFCRDGNDLIYECPDCVADAYCNPTTNFTCSFFECPVGTFTLPDFSCEPCPANSHATESGRMSCSCIHGYYRASQDTRYDSCTRSPSAPLGATVSNVTNTSVVLSWLPSESDGGRDFSEIFYFVYIMGLGMNIPNKQLMTTNTELTIESLIPYSRYVFVIKSQNQLFSVDNTTFRQTNTSTATLEGVGGTVTFDGLPTGFSVYLNLLIWSPPNPPNGIILYYNAMITSIGVGEVYVPLIKEINTTSLDLQSYTSDGDFYVEIQAVTSVGAGNFSHPVQVSVFGSETPPTSAPPNVTDVAVQTNVEKDLVLIALFPPISVVLVAVGVFGFLYHRRYKKRKMKKRKFRESLGFHHNPSSTVDSDIQNESHNLKLCGIQHKRGTSGNKYIENPSLVETSFFTQVEHLSQQLPHEAILQQENIQLLNVIGEGEFGQVYKGYMKTKYKTDVVAVKTLKALSSASDIKLLMKEIVKMVNFDHPNVMTLIGVILDSNGRAPLLVMPFMMKGTLLTYVRDNKAEFLLQNTGDSDQVSVVSKTLCEFARQIALGMEYLAKNKVVHRDLAARNCLLDMTGTVKVADFGLSEDMYSTNYFRQGSSSSEAVETKVPIRWMPLESIEEGLYTEKSDVWSYGVTVWEIFTCGKVPYHGISCMALPGLLHRGEHLERPHNAACSEEVYTLLVDCWNVVLQQRPKFTQILHRIDELMEERFGYMRIESSISLHVNLSSGM